MSDFSVQKNPFLLYLGSKIRDYRRQGASLIMQITGSSFQELRVNQLRLSSMPIIVESKWEMIARVDVPFGNTSVDREIKKSNGDSLIDSLGRHECSLKWKGILRKPLFIPLKEEALEREESSLWSLMNKDVELSKSIRKLHCDSLSVVLGQTLYSDRDAERISPIDERTKGVTWFIVLEKGPVDEFTKRRSFIKGVYNTLNRIGKMTRFITMEEMKR